MFMFLRVKFALTAKGQTMKIHKQAAIKTALIILSFFMLTTFLAFVMINIPTNWILPIFGIVLLGIVIQAIYKVVLSQMKWDEEILEREQEWKRIDSERYERKMNHHDTK
jgi:uncharacterized membrane protein YfcA